MINSLNTPKQRLTTWRQVNVFLTSFRLYHFKLFLLLQSNFMSSLRWNFKRSKYVVMSYLVFCNVQMTSITRNYSLYSSSIFQNFSYLPITYLSYKAIVVTYRPVCKILSIDKINLKSCTYLIFIISRSTWQSLIFITCLVFKLINVLLRVFYRPAFLCRPELDFLCKSISLI